MPTADAFMAEPPGPRCPEPHLKRILTAGAWDCPDHGCPLCVSIAGSVCSDCINLHSAVIAHEDRGRVADPWCIEHGLPTPETRRSCKPCDWAVRYAKHEGWKRPTGHQGLNCARCAVCGLCACTGKVCGDCFRCPEHPTDDDLVRCCTQFLERRAATRVARRFGPRLVPVYTHRYFDPERLRWAA